MVSNEMKKFNGVELTRDDEVSINMIPTYMITALEDPTDEKSIASIR